MDSFLVSAGEHTRHQKHFVMQQLYTQKLQITARSFDCRLPFARLTCASMCLGADGAVGT